eukprot:CAMPEP_0178426006 /NCGR_PEP_ID=MMETSP0689_2-20121128/29014_1 /TAXON_ID=160604 /ORGANISM="Amphidinium massartii, Strain CS-259" /LENGTH=79 /DNA_ID=CAMNT_0020047683 /DNA_START=119 /DNA_END=358 /DNA_ORIENTATION=+
MYGSKTICTSALKTTRRSGSLRAARHKPSMPHDHSHAGEREAQYSNHVRLVSSPGTKASFTGSYGELVPISCLHVSPVS